MGFSLPPPGFKFSGFVKNIPDAYHGTSQEAAAKILATTFLATRGNHLHLGDDVYFYDGCFESAAWWARNRNYVPPIVLRSEVNLGDCIDFENRQHKTIISQFAHGLHQRMQNSAQLRDSLPPLCDGVIINLAAKLANADAVRASYIESDHGKKLHPWSQFAWSGRRVICVRKTNMISGTTIAQN